MDQLLTLLREGNAPAAHPLPTTGSSPGARPTEPAGTVWPDPAPAEQDGEQPHRGDPRDTAGTPTPTPAPEAPRPGSRRSRRPLLLTAALTAVLAAVVTTTVVLTRGGGPAPSSAATPADLTDGWKPWTAQAKAPEGARRTPGRDSSFQRCTSVGPSLVCAGAQIMATRFDLAGGHNTWSRFVDPTAPDGSSFDEGAIIGTDRGRVCAYQADERQMAGGAGPLFTYTVAALAADTGKVLWRTRTALGQTASVPDGEQGGTTAVPEGVITLYGDQGEQYALLDADTGEVRWKRPRPQVADDCRLRTATERAYLICTTGRWHKGTARTSVSQLSAATGKPSWTVEAKGALDVLGQDGDHLVLADEVSPGGGLTLVDVSSRALTAVRVFRKHADASGVYLVRGTVYFTRDSGGVSAVSPRTGRTLWDGGRRHPLRPRRQRPRRQHLGRPPHSGRRRPVHPVRRAVGLHGRRTRPVNPGPPDQAESARPLDRRRDRTSAMSWVANVMISAADADRANVEALSAWLSAEAPHRGRPDASGVGDLNLLTDQDPGWGGWKWPECQVWAGALNHCDLDALRKRVAETPWREPNVVQLLVMDQEESFFRLWMIRGGELRQYAPLTPSEEDAGFYLT
ncbi:PQQ-binding-like beta-propeller repeat protein [Streptomyces afghaniensis]|uniref:outer membrane protein assembly factor BamB family protein n=1 Tax=Streptomyces afghaniensis TaxID=66865 RepID=UPI0037A38495